MLVDIIELAKQVEKNTADLKNLQQDVRSFGRDTQRLRVHQNEILKSMQNLALALGDLARSIKVEITRKIDPKDKFW